jgi:hypothetical protein
MAVVTLVPLEDDTINIPYRGKIAKFVLPSPQGARAAGSAADDTNKPQPDGDRRRRASPNTGRPPRALPPQRPRIRVRPSVIPLAIQMDTGEWARARFVRVASRQELEALVTKIGAAPHTARRRRPHDLIVSLTHPGIDIGYATEKLSSLPEETRVSLVVI